MLNATQRRHMATRIWVNIGSGNGLVPDVTKSLPEPMLACYQWGSVAFTREAVSNFTVSAQPTTLHCEFKNDTYKITVVSPSGQWVNVGSFSIYHLRSRENGLSQLEKLLQM